MFFFVEVVCAEPLRGGGEDSPHYTLSTRHGITGNPKIGTLVDVLNVFFSQL